MRRCRSNLLLIEPVAGSWARPVPASARTDCALDIFHYDALSSECLRKLHFAVIDFIGSRHAFLQQYSGNDVTENYFKIVDCLRRVRGLKRLVEKAYKNFDEWDELEEYMTSGRDISHVFDAVELAAIYRRREKEKFQRDVNKAFFFEAAGYRLEGDEVIRLDSEFVHAEAVKPAIHLLSGADWEGASDEFFEAHDHFRHGRKEEAHVAALKSIESTMKIICDKKKWRYDPKSAAFKDLVKICFDSGLIPPFWDNMMTYLRCLLEASVPSGRNKLGGHGQGAQVREVPDYVTAFILHMTASAIVFLRQAFDASEAGG